MAAISIRKVNEKYVSYIAWLIIALILFLALRKFPLSSPEVGDESSYRQEVDYFAHSGMFQALSQGTSFLLTLLIYGFAKIFSVSFLVSSRILSVIFFLISGQVLLKIFKQFAGLDYVERYFGLVVYGTIASGWLWKGLADITSFTFFLTAFYLLTRYRGAKYYVLAGLLLFLGFAVKPVILIALPGLFLFTLLKDRKQNGLGKNFLRTCIVGFTFSVCFIVYHIPGYKTYHRLMLEDKNHTYQGDTRVENTTSWEELNNYFTLYNVHNKPNKWAITWSELDSFKKEHPEANLRMGYTQYVKTHTGDYVKNMGGKFFLSLPYSMQSGFFFSKWTVINKYLKNIFLIKLVTLLLIAGMCIRERKFIQQNAVLLIVPLCYYILLCLYSLAQLEENWLIFCLPLLVLPVVKFLLRYVNVYVLLALQIVFLIV